MNRYSYMMLDQRRKIERIRNAGIRTFDIAAHIWRGFAAVSVVLRRGCAGERNEN